MIYALALMGPGFTDDGCTIIKLFLFSNQHEQVLVVLSPLEIKDDKPQMIGGIVGGASAFLLLLLLIIGIVAYV